MYIILQDDGLCVLSVSRKVFLFIFLCLALLPEIALSASLGCFNGDTQLLYANPKPLNLEAH